MLICRVGQDDMRFSSGAERIWHALGAFLLHFLLQKIGVRHSYPSFLAEASAGDSSVLLILRCIPLDAAFTTHILEF